MTHVSATDGDYARLLRIGRFVATLGTNFSLNAAAERAPVNPSINVKEL
jgi:hypothetical protein